MAEEEQPKSSFPWARGAIHGARELLRRGLPSWRRLGREPQAEPRNAIEAAGSFGRHAATTIANVPLGATETAMNWYDFARTGDAGWITPGDVLAPTGAGMVLRAGAVHSSLGVFGGRVAARNLEKAGRPTAREALDLAEGMEQRGFNPLEIRQATNDFIARNDPALGGVHKGAEGLWRFEISDAFARGTSVPGSTLGQVLHHPEFFQAYPRLARTEVTAIEGKEAWWRPSMTFAPGTIAIGAGFKGNESVLATFHEIQHAAQHTERFARGTNLEEMRAWGKQLKPGAGRLSEKEAVDAYMRTAGEVEARNVEKRAPLTAGERRELHPVLTEDVPRAKQFVLRGDSLTKAMQLTPGAAPKVTLHKLRELEAPNKSVTSVAFEMRDAAGKPIGKINAGFYPAAGEMKIHMIQLAGVEEGVSANMLKPGDVKSVIRELKRHYPGIKSVSGTRITGVRGSRDVREGAVPDAFTDVDDITKIKLSGSVKGVTALPPSVLGFQAPIDPLPYVDSPHMHEPLFKAWDRMTSILENNLLPGVERALSPMQEALRRYYELRGTLRRELTADPFNTDDESRWSDKPSYDWLNPGAIQQMRWRSGGEPGGRLPAADAHIGRSAFRRVTVESVDDSGQLQAVTVVGHDGERFELAIAGQGFGLTSVPPAGAIGYGFMANGRPDQFFLLGLELPGVRPKDQLAGEVTLYGQQGQAIVMGADGNLRISAPGELR